MTDKRRQIISAATSLFLEEGVGVSTARIAKAAGVSNGTLFNVFATKQELIDAIYLEGKRGMFGVQPFGGEDRFDRASLKANWDAYLSWARAHPGLRRVMTMLFEAGLASDAARAEGERLAAPQGMWFARAYAMGQISGPSVSFLMKAAFMQLELVIELGLLEGEAEAAFETLCKTLDLSGN